MAKNALQLPIESSLHLVQNFIIHSNDMVQRLSRWNLVYWVGCLPDNADVVVPLWRKNILNTNRSCDPYSHAYAMHSKHISFSWSCRSSLESFPIVLLFEFWMLHHRFGRPVQCSIYRWNNQSLSRRKTRTLSSSSQASHSMASSNLMAQNHRSAIIQHIVHTFLW